MMIDELLGERLRNSGSAFNKTKRANLCLN
jgi:hypothetical protein